VSDVIVVGFDDQPAAERALDRAIEEARARHARLLVVTVLELSLDPTGPRNYGTLDDGPFPGHLAPTPAIEQALVDARARVEAAHMRAEYLWAAGDPARTLVDLAADRRARAIVIGEHHGGFFSGLFGLDVETQVKRDAGCDVIVVA
jgi:nucleotide-binding universal stress UspA family protein